MKINHQISARRSGVVKVGKKKRTCSLAIREDYGVKMKKREKIDKYLDLAKYLKKLRNMKVTVIPIAIGTQVLVTKGMLN